MGVCERVEGTYLTPCERTNTCENISFQQLCWRTVIHIMEMCFTYHIVGLKGVGLLYVLIMVDDGDVSEVGVLEHYVVQVGDVPEVRLGVPANSEQLTRSLEYFANTHHRQ